MQNLQTNEPLLQHFQVEELEERLENCWQGEEWQDRGHTVWNAYTGQFEWQENWVKVPCGTANPNEQAGPSN